MNRKELREVLGRVAVGELEADEAARLLDPDAASPEDHDIRTEPAAATARQWAPLWLGRL
jgi:hypothetical protein